jgi:C-terminal processing protease CtpA/Prc
MYKRASIVFLSAVLGAVAGAFVVAHFTSGDLSAGHVPGTVGHVVERLTSGRSAKLDPGDVSPVLESIVQTLDKEIAERRILAEQLEELQSQMTDLQQNLPEQVQTAFQENTADIQESDSFSRQEQTVEQAIEERLVAAGFTLQQVENLRRLEAEAQMRQIELDDRARREGWVNSPRYMEEFSTIMNGGDAVRRDLGDDAYDRYLFAMGRPNRMAVGSVIQTSPAAQAGLKPGDVIMSYDGERIFSPQQLNNLRSAGDRGSPVTVEIVRDKLRMQITMPRGPMGIQLQPHFVEPGSL